MNQPVFAPPVAQIPVTDLRIGEGAYGAMPLAFGVPQPVTDANGVIVGATVQWTHQVLLSPMLAVQLHAMLGDVIASYEARFGAIPRLAINHSRNGEVIQPESQKQPCPLCYGNKKAFNISMGEWVDCGICAGTGETAVESAGVSILEQFRKPPQS